MAVDYVGAGSLEDYLTRHMPGGGRFLVASAGTIARLPATARALILPDNPRAVISDFQANPTADDIRRGCDAYRSAAAGIILAVGGGSAIDVAKTVKAVAHAGSAFRPEAPGALRVSGDGPPLVAIPTTAGSGSEATHFAVYYTGEAKQSLADPRLLPDAAVVDPILCESMSPGLTAATGFDALAQAVESFWANGATEESRAYAERAIGLVLPNIVRAVHNPGPENRLAMSEGAHLAGKAINVAKTTAPHALSYFITKRYGVPHGHAAALMLPFFFLVNAGGAGSAYPPPGDTPISETMTRLAGLLGESSPLACARMWLRLLERCCLAPTLAAMGVDRREAIEEIIASANPERLSNNPATFTRESLLRLIMNGLPTG